MSKLTFATLFGFTAAALSGQALAPGGIWETKAPMPTARVSLAGAQLNGVVYAIGGYNLVGGFSLFASNQAYDGATNSWSAKAAMPPRGMGWPQRR